MEENPYCESLFWIMEELQTSVAVILPAVSLEYRSFDTFVTNTLDSESNSSSQVMR